MLIHAPVGAKYNPVRSRADYHDLMGRLQWAHANGGIDVFSMGPIYKLNQTWGSGSGNGTEWDAMAGGVQELLDEIRITFGAAILVEAHAGRSGPSVKGSSDWENWPEWLKSMRMRSGDAFTRTIHDVRPTRYADIYQWWPHTMIRHNDRMPNIARWPDGTLIADGGPPAYMRRPDWHLESLGVNGDGPTVDDPGPGF
jgi:hypothetical protein